jgi:tetratricopeptide (TPR) repeat protein
VAKPFLVGVILLVAIAVPVDALAQRDKRKKPNDFSVAAKLMEAEAAFTEGQKFYILEDYSKALLYFLKASELNPGNAAVYYKLADVLSKSEREEDSKRAAINIDQAIRLDKKNPYYYLSAVNIYNSQGNFSKSASLLETMIKEVPDSEEQLYELAAIYLFDKKEDEAIKTYNRAEAIFGINEASSFQKQRIYLDQGKIKEAIFEGEKIIAAYPEEERYVLGLAELLSQNKQRDNAIAKVEGYLKENPQSPNAKMLLSGFYRDNGQDEKARQLIQELFNDTHASVNSKVIMLGALQTDLAQKKQKQQNVAELQSFVMSLYKKLEADYPTEASVHMVGGDLFVTADQPSEARQHYAKAVRLGINSFEAWQSLLYLETEANLLDSVINHADQALEYFPTQSMVYYFKGYAHLRKREFSYAVNSLEQAKKLSSSNPALVVEINAWLGDAYQALKQYEKSAKAYDEVLATNPDNDIVLNNYSYYLALRNTELEKAEKMSAQLVKSHPDNAAYLDTHAWVLYTREKYREAKKYIEKAIQSGNVSATHFEHYGDILFKLGDVDAAVVQWKKAKSLGQSNEFIDKKITNRKIL